MTSTTTMPDLSNPFPGLRCFLSEEDYLFFGRHEQIEDLLRRLRTNRLVAVVGTSGSGKSSLVRAGLLPAVLGGGMAQAGSAWEIAVMRPGGSPLAHLARALCEAGLYDADAEDALFHLQATLSRSRNGLIEAVRQSQGSGVRGQESGSKLLLVVDQFEELFRFNRASATSQEEAIGFVNLLLHATQQADQNVYVVPTMRSDFLGECSQFLGLAEAVNDGEFLIPRMTRDQIQEAIEGPIRVRGAAIAPRLLFRLLNDVQDNQDQLPVLQHALMRTWDLWQRSQESGVRSQGSALLTPDSRLLTPASVLDLDHYETTGGMHEALSRHADEIFEAFPSEPHRTAAARVFKALTERGPDGRGIRRPTRLGQLAAIAAVDASIVHQVIEAYRAPGVTFLMPPVSSALDDSTVIDVSHESLMRVWHQLRGWVELEAQSARIYRRLHETADLHAEQRAGLYHDPDLQIARSWREISEPNSAWAGQYGGGFAEAMAFLDTSREAAGRAEKEREAARQHELERARQLAEAQARVARLFKRFVGGLAVGLCLAVALTVWTLMLWHEAELQAQEAKLQEDAANGLRQVAQEKQEKAKALGLVQRVLNVSTPKVPAIIGEMTEHRHWSDPLLRKSYDKAAEKSSQKLHASLALLPVDAGQVNYLFGRLLEADPEAVPVIRDALAAHKDGLLDKLWAVVEKPEKGKESQRLRAAAALAKYHPDSQRWAHVQGAVGNDLVAVPAADLTPWKDALRPVRVKLLAPLSLVYRSIDRPAERSLATDILADYAADQPQVLANLLMDADDQQFAVIYPKFKEQGERGLPILTSEFGREFGRAPPPLVKSDWTVRFYKWQAAEQQKPSIDLLQEKPPADWEAMLKSPILDELRMPRLHFVDANLSPKPPTPKVPQYYFALVATTEVTLGEGEYIIKATCDDGVRVWLDNEVVIEDWRTTPPTTKSVTVVNKPGRHIIKVEFFQAKGGYDLDVDFLAIEHVQEMLAKRQANAAVALLRMNQPEKVWPLLKHSPDPRARSYLIHRLSPLGADANAIVKQLDKESDVTIRRALLLSLGDFGEKDFTPDARKALLPKLQDMYRTATDPGLHAASEWLLRQWKADAWLQETNQAWAGDKQQQLKRLEEVMHELKNETSNPERRWYVNGQGQTLVVIPGPVEFWMGSPPAEEGRAGGPAGTIELRHWRRIGRSFAIASKEVTVEQFLRFRKDHPVLQQFGPSSDCPVNMVTWYDAAAYCNWLSEQEGLPQEQWCYEPNKEGKYAQGMKMAANYLQRTGYRLPTEAEWEFSCRAGAVTKFCFGESDELEPRYAWTQKNSQYKSWPVGSLKPNDLGLFDMHGNAWEWCQDAYKPYGTGGDGKATQNIEDIADITNSKQRVLRGGAFETPVSNWGSARRSIDRVPSTRFNSFGFRPSRTLPFSSFNRYAAARAAALAAAGQGKNKPPLDDAAKAQLRRQALDWLKAELTDWSKVQPPRVFIVRNLWQWQQDSDLAGIRDKAAMAKLPAEEQKAFTQFWANVAKAAEPANNTERLDFARVAVLIAAVQGKDESPFDDAAKAKLRGQALAWLKAELTVAADRAGKARIVAAAAPLPGLLEKLVESAPNDGQFQAELARHFAERGNNPLANAARTKARALFGQQLAKEPQNAALAAELTDLLLIDPTRWTVLKPAEMKSAGAATLTLQADGSILAGGARVKNDTYTILAPARTGRLAAVLLEIPDPTLPGGRVGGGRAVALSNVSLALLTAADAAPIPIPFGEAFSDIGLASHAIDGNPDTFWGIWPEFDRPHLLVLKLAKPLDVPDKAQILIRLEFLDKKYATDALGRFRLSVSGDPAILQREQQRLAILKATDPWLKLAAAYALNGRNDKATEYFSKALQADPKLGDDRQAGHRYNAARAAALAAAGQGKDEPPLDDAAKAKLRGQALDWLKAELNASSKLFESGPPQARPAIMQILLHWQQDSDLAGVRDAAALAKLPADEQKEWRALWARLPDLKTVVPTSKEEGQKWRYTTQQPAEGWHKADFEDKEWQEGIGAFGSAAYAFRTEWKTDDIWLRREFTMPQGKWDDLLLLLDHDDDAEVYVNGVLALKAPGWSSSNYEEMPLSAAARTALKPGKNVFAVHCHNNEGPQYIDVGIVAVKGNAGRLAFAQLFYDRQQFAGATQLWAAALASDPKLGENRQAGHRYNAARAAALAAAGQGVGDPPFDDAAKAKLRGQALDWLRAELTACGKPLEFGPPQDRPSIVQALSLWRKQGDLAGVRDPAVLAQLPAEEQKAFTQLWADVAALLLKAEEELTQRPDDLAAADALAGLLLEKVEPKWTALKPLTVKSQGGATLTVQPDASVLAGGVNPDKDVYVIETQVEGRIRAVRLEVIPDPTMPGGGSGRNLGNGNFVLTDFRVTAGESAATWSRALTDFSQENFPIGLAIDADESTGWAVDPRCNSPHWAVFIPRQPITTTGKTALTIRLSFRSGYSKHTLGRFRLSVTDSDALQHAEWFAAASTAHAKVGAAYLALGDFRRAVDFLTKATAANPKVPAADWLFLALAHARLKETDQARKACGKAAELLKPTGAEAAQLRPLLREVLLAMGPNSPEATALIAAAAGDPPAALNEAIRQNPDKASGYRDRGNWFAERGRWKEASADLTGVFRLEPETLYGMRLGILLIHSGEIDRYRVHCLAMLERWASTEKNSEADQTLKMIVLLPDFKADAKQLARLAEVAVSGNKNVDWFEWWMFAKGLHDYRTGKYADALAACREIRLRVPKTKGDAQVLTSLNLAIEAMALHRSGDEAGAKRALAEAKSNVEVHVPGIDGGDWSHDWLAAHILYREAEGLIAGKKAEQPK